MRGCQFAGNRTNLPGHSSFNAAGAIHGNASIIRIANSRFANNQAGYVGSAIYVLGPWEKAMDLEVTDSLFTGNVAMRHPGGTKAVSANKIYPSDRTAFFLDSFG